jgi:hypothetical protein
MTTEIIVLTDGEVWDTEQVIKFVQETRTKTEERVRFFALGIGNAVSHRLVEGIGRQGGGFAEVVAVGTGKRWESRVIRMLKGALMPSTWQCEITLREENDTFPPDRSDSTSTEGAVPNDMLISQQPVLQAPNRIPPMHTFLRSSVYFLVDPQVLGRTKSVTVQAVASSGERARLEIPLEQVEAQPPTIHHLVGKALMNDLEIGQSWMHADKYQKFKSKDPVAFEQAVQQEAEKVGIKWCIAGKWTSFVTVDNGDQVERNARIYRAGRRDLPDLTRQRWVARQSNPVDLSQHEENTPFVGAPRSARNYAFDIQATNSVQGFVRGEAFIDLGGVNEARVPSQEITIDNLTSLQTSSGSFILTTAMFRSRLMSHFSHKVISEMDQCIKKVIQWTTLGNVDFQLLRAIRNTVLIVAFIKFQYPESAELWELVVLKARGWVRRNLRDPDGLTELEKIARDNIDSASSAVPATGSSDVPMPMKLAKSTGNADIVAKEVDEDDFKEHAVGEGAETETVVEAKSG